MSDREASDTEAPPGRPAEVHLVRDVLDKQLVAVGGHDPVGKADGLVMECRAGRPPRVVAVECGAAALARRVHPRLEGWARWVGGRIGVRGGRSHFFRWARLGSIGHAEVEVAVDPDRCPTTAWERWLRRHVTRHVPGSGNFGGRS